MYDLTGKTSLITGGAQGIGFGIALELARVGSRVVIADRDVHKARLAAEKIEGLGHKAAAALLDVTDEEAVRSCVESVISHCVRIDVLVNNAGIHCERIGQVSTIDHFNKCLDVNLLGAWRMTLALLPHFRMTGGGRIINIASIDGRKPWTDTPAYSASKAALISLTQSLAIKLGALNTNVNAVCPGGVMTAMADAFKPDRLALEEEIIQARALKRALTVEDVGRAVVFFAAPQSKNITGQSLNVDGGAVMS